MCDCERAPLCLHKSHPFAPYERVESLKTKCSGGGGDPCVNVSDGAMNHSARGERGEVKGGVGSKGWH